MQLSRAPSSLSTRDAPARLSNESAEDWWNSIPKVGRDYGLRGRKKTQQYDPIPTSNKNKVQKRRRNPLPTPRATPVKGHRARKSDEDEPEDAGMAKDAAAPKNWEKEADEMSFSG